MGKSRVKKKGDHQHSGRGTKELQMDLKKTLRQYGETFFLATFLAIAIKSYFISAYKIPTSSMAPTLKVGDFIFGFKWPFSINSKLFEIDKNSLIPKRGEVIIFKCPDELELNCVKRVVGLPGDKIELKGKRLYINGQVAFYHKGQQFKALDISGDEIKIVLEEEAIDKTYNILISDSLSSSDFGPVVVPPEHIFVLGDNRDFSEDSRTWGSIPILNVVGKAMFIWMSLDWGKVGESNELPRIRWDRIFKGFSIAN